MTKKHFTITSIIIALLIFAILPIINYIVDPSRVLHHDYLMRYKKFHQHELVLKTVYLIEHKNNYDTLVFGSSRGGYIDMTKITDKAFNLSHGFGTVATYLHTLETLLNSGVKVKNVWIGVNDFDIWKDHTEELSRLVYHNNLFQDAKLYAHWLFRFIPQVVTMLKDNSTLIKTNEVTAQHEHLVWSRQQENNIVKKLKHRHIAAAPLGYQEKFRIDDAIEDIRKIKSLCDSQDINLTVFMYPSYYKTYLIYDQNKIETFKRKLASVSDFYDFYDLGEVSLNPHKWFEGSHFVPSVGDMIIDSIHTNTHKVTPKNIETRIMQTRDYLKYMPILKDEDIYMPNKTTQINTNKLKIVFDLQDKHFKYTKNNQFTLQEKNQHVQVVVDATDPMFIIEHAHTNSKQVILLVDIDSPQESLFQLYYKPAIKSVYSEGNSFKIPLHKGNNSFRIIMNSKYINHGLRVDFTRKTGIYQIQKFIIKALEQP